MYISQFQGYFPQIPFNILNHLQLKIKERFHNFDESPHPLAGENGYFADMASIFRPMEVPETLHCHITPHMISNPVDGVRMCWSCINCLPSSSGCSRISL